MVGRVGVEPTTSRLSGVRSNHLSYRPPTATKQTRKGRVRLEPAQAYTLDEDGPNRIQGGYDPWPYQGVFQDEGT